MLGVFADVMPNLVQKTVKLGFGSAVERGLYELMERQPEMFQKGTRSNSTAVMEAIMTCRQMCCSPLIFLKNRYSIKGHLAHLDLKRSSRDVFDSHCLDASAMPQPMRDLIAAADDLPSTKLQWVYDDVMR